MWNWDPRLKERLKLCVWGKRLVLWRRKRRTDNEKLHYLCSSWNTKENQLSKSRNGLLWLLAWLGEMKHEYKILLGKEITWEKWMRKAKSPDLSVGIFSGPWNGQPRKRGSISGSPNIFLFSPKSPNSLWGPPRPLFSAYQERFPQG